MFGGVKTSMAVQVEEITPTKICFIIEVGAEKVQSEREKVFQEMAKHVYIRGFRKGKAPRKMVEKYINPESLKQEVLERLVPAAYDEALKSHKYIPITRPQYDLLEFQDSGPLKFKATFECRPEIPLNKYKGLEVQVKKRELTQEDVEKTIQSLRESRAIYEDWHDGVITEGEGGIFDLQGFVDGKPFEGGSFQGILLEIKKDWVIPGFIEQILGMKAGEEREVHVTLPQNFDPAIAGKEAMFKVRVQQVKRKKLPDLDDAFAQSLGDFKTLEELKNAVKKNIETYLSEQEKTEGFQKAIEHLSETLNFPVPDLFIEDRMKQFERDTLHMLEHSGKPFQDFLREKYPEVFVLEGVSEDEKMKRAVAKFREELQPKALKMAKVDLILDEIWRRENLRITQEEINHEINRVASRYQMPPQDLAKALQKDEHAFQTFVVGMLRAKASLLVRDHLKLSYLNDEKEAKNE
jgi:trigger factor